MADLGLRESGLDRVIRASYDLLGYISFFTVGEDENRAWSIPRNTPAVIAAGEIHSDISRGFIRAEVVRYEHLLARRTIAACRDHGELRLEGKDYVVQDGDVINFRHATYGELAVRRIWWVDAVIATPSIRQFTNRNSPIELMTVQTVLVCEAQVPFVHGGAEVHVRQLVRELRARGYTTELVSVPFKWYPKEEILPHAAAWRLLDLSESNGRPVDLVIGTKFPSYFARHPNKVAWLIHQYRAAYELCGTEYSDFAHTELDVGLRDTLMRLDTKMLGECRALFTNARNTASRLAKFNGLPAEPLYHPPKLASRLVPGPYSDYVLSVGRIESVKRVDLIIAAMASVPSPIRLVIAGDGTQRQNAERAAAEAGVADRVTFLGNVGDDDSDRVVRTRAGGGVSALR